MVELPQGVSSSARNEALQRSGVFPDLALAERKPGRSPARNMAAYICSAFGHAGALMVLAFCMLPVLVGHRVIVNAVFVADGAQLESIRISDEIPGLMKLDGESVPAERSATLEVPQIEISLESANAADGIDLGTATSSGIAVEASTIEGAVDRITGGIEGKLQGGDLLVVWLLDASHSLVDDRQRVAARLEPFFERTAKNHRDASGHQLLNAVVSFGSGMKQRVAPTEAGEKVVTAVEKLPIDSSGKENVFTAIARCAETYRRNWPRSQIAIVVWMDETGDDVHQLEETIPVCRTNRVSVSVVGPSSVLGAETGLHSYTDPKTDIVYQLPVKRGPDSALPERIDLGYWFRVRPPGSRGGRRLGGALPSWYGGHDLQGIISGFSPYALTRLAVATGGSYTIFDRPEDRGPFRWDAMQAYAPDYRSAQAYLRDVEARPLRQAVHLAVEATAGKDLSAPEIMLFVNRDKHHPLEFFRPYFTPAQFTSKLRSRRRSLQQKADRVSRAVEEALTHVSRDGQIDRPLDDEYAQEDSIRWRAWYDLTRGRLLATSVRLEEYRLALETIVQQGSLEATTNHVILLPSSEMRSGTDFETRAQEAEALLTRCVRENPDTPWAYLAQRELAHSLGISVRQMALTPTAVLPASRDPKLPRL